MSVVFSLPINIDQKSFAAPQDERSGLYYAGTKGKALILVHGLTGTPNEMLFTAKYFNERGYTVICPRLANHGKPLGVLNKTTWRELYASIKDVMQSKEILDFRGPVFAAGLSMGATLTLLLGLEFPDRIKGISCLSPALFYDGWNAPSSRHLLPIAYVSFLKYYFYYKKEPPYGFKNEALQARLRKQYEKARVTDIMAPDKYGYPFYPVSLLCELKNLVGHLEGKLPEMRFPVQIIHAKQDDMASIRNARFIYDRIGSPRKELILLENSYHLITADNERGFVAEKMEEFYRSLS